MAFIIFQDLDELIRLDNFDVATDDNEALLGRMLPSVLEEVASYIRHYYDTDKALAPIEEWDVTNEYALDARVIDTSTNKLYYAIDAVVASTPITDTDFWTEGDARNPKLKDLVVDILLFNVMSRARPNELPVNRVNRYADAVSYLKDVQKGRVDMALPVIDDTDLEDDEKNVETVTYGQADAIVNKYNTI